MIEVLNSEMNLKLILLLFVSVTVIHAGPDDWASCVGQTGVTFASVPVGPPPPIVHHDNGGPSVVIPPFHYEQLECCKAKNYQGTDPKGYKFYGGQYKLVILCAQLNPGAKLYIKTVKCLPSGEKKIIVIDDSAVFPLDIPMSSGTFKFSSEKEFSVAFLATNQPKTGCQCPGACDAGWDKHGDNCYKKSTLKDGFHEVEDNCNSLHDRSYLASVHSDAEHNYIKGKFTPVSEAGIWIGLHDLGFGDAAPRKWQWTDCTPYDYTKWRIFEPNNSGGSEDCLEMRTAFSYIWNDIPCHINLFGVCKYYLPPGLPIGK